MNRSKHFLQILFPLSTMAPENPDKSPQIYVEKVPSVDIGHTLWGHGVGKLGGDCPKKPQPAPLPGR
jgi:hypothetical protein